MPDWDVLLLGNSVRAWLTALALFAGLFVALRLLRRLLLRLARRATALPSTGLDEVLIDLIERTSGLTMLLVAAYVAAQWLALPERWDGALVLLLKLGLILQFGFWGSGVINRFIQRRIEREQEDQDAVGATTFNVMGYVLRVAFWVIVVLILLDNLPGVEVTALVASLGVGGIAVALAVQNILSDLLASLAIVVDKPFVIGDFIIVGDLMGTVEQIGLKTTRVRSLSGEQIIFSNSDLLSSRVRNFKRMAERRVVFTLGVVYETPPEQVARVPEMLREIIEAQEPVRFDRAHFKAFGDFALVFEAVYYVLVPDYNVYMDIQQRINLEILRRFEAEGIEFAYPTQTVYVQRAEAVA